MRHNTLPDDRIDVLFVVLPDTLLLDLAGPAEAFRLANQALTARGQPERFQLRFAGPRAEVGTSVGLAVAALEGLPAEPRRPTWIVLPGRPGHMDTAAACAWRETAQWLGREVARWLGDAPGHRLVTICAGALLAADAGLVHGRRCTTHHELLSTLQSMAPTADVVNNRVFVEDGPLASSAGITAGIDLALHLIAQVAGDGVAAQVAQAMVVYLRRGPHDPELSPMLQHRNHLHPAVHRVQDAVCADPTHPWHAAEMARTGHVTPRHLHRLFTVHAGVTPLEYLQRIRVERARQALAQGATVGQAAELAGFSSDLALRRAWRRYAEGTPSAQRPH
jgi:transcriptional regulator GlxA family with amidase domain